MNVSIEKIEIISFGKLKNASVTVSSGINVLSAPNESGKSTLASFIKFVFYGYTGSRMQTLSDNEKKLYTPWDSEISEGSVTIKADDNRYIIHRRCVASGKDTVEVTNRNTGRPEFSGQVPGEVFFGVSEDVFVRTLFFRQLTTPQSKDEILADRLKNIAISADEQVGTKKAVQRLNESKNELKGRLGSGLIPKAERERDELEEAITASTDTRREVLRLNAEIKKRSETITDAEAKLKSLGEERRNIEKYEASLRLRNIERLAIEEENARAEYESASAGLKKRDDVAFRELFAKNTEYVAECRDCEKIKTELQEAETEKAELLSDLKIEASDIKTAKRLLNTSKKISNILFVFAAVLIIGGVIAFLASENTKGLGIIIAVLGVICGAIGMVMLAKPTNFAKDIGLSGAGELKDAVDNFPMIEKQLKDSDARISVLKDELEESVAYCTKLKRELDEGIGNYIDVSDENYSEQLNHILSLSSESGEKLAVWRAKKEDLDNATKDIDLDSLAEEAKGAITPERDRARVDRELVFYNSQFNQLSELNRRDELEMATLEARSGDPALMVGKRDSLNARIDELSLKYKGYETAVKYIEDAADYMKSMVAPRIGERADEYFSAATGGKYSSLEVDTRMSMSFGEDIRRNCEYLSAGTRDSAYLSLRLALADMLFGGCGVPILLDDAFGRIDDTRLRMMSGALNEAAKKHQIFILTHGNREKDAFDDLGIAYSEISIKTE
ncbi:MAG: AAA family ATPase [Clostridia bacterium]|nr:AAA family ATPase [Clostridia bacterium]